MPPDLFGPPGVAVDNPYVDGEYTAANGNTVLVSAVRVFEDLGSDLVLTDASREHYLLPVVWEILWV